MAGVKGRSGRSAVKDETGSGRFGGVTFPNSTIVRLQKIKTKTKWDAAKVVREMVEVGLNHEDEL